MIYKQVLAEHAQLTTQIAAIQKELEKMPEGHLFCTRNATRYKWYHSDGHQQTYIPKRQRSYAQALAQKKYLTLYLDELIQERSAIEYYLRHHPLTSKATELLTDTSPYAELLKDIFIPQSQTLAEWAASSFDSNPKHPEQLIHKTLSGHFVRSKSEALIDTLLYDNKLPFRYETPLQIGDITIYPDFTIRHPQTGEFYYWEHFGMMDNDTYAKNAFAKLQLYHSVGIIPSIQLITTFETSKHPLCAQIIEKEISCHFL